MKNIAILGSTGSIGAQTLDIVREQKDLRVKALAAYKNVDLIFEQIREFKPDVCALYDEAAAKKLKKKLEEFSMETKVLSGMEGLTACACHKEVSMVVAAMVGMIGIRPVLSAIEDKKDIALANKETLVTAGHLIMDAVKKNGVSLFPVDSEHSAIFQCLKGYDREQRSKVSKIILTASGGSFWNTPMEKLENATVEEALKHPNWSMGKKITVDSSTMVNKGLEVIEAHWLFDMDYDKISVIIQPQSIIHSMVEFCDGAVMAQLGTPDMRLPIQYALCYAKREESLCRHLDFTKIGAIEFYPADDEKFPALPLAYEAGRYGHGMPAVYNAANEFLVARFLNKEETYMGIVNGIKRAMKWWDKTGIYEMELSDREPSLEEIIEIEGRVRKELEQI